MVRAPILAWNLARPEHATGLGTFSRTIAHRIEYDRAQVVRAGEAGPLGERAVTSCEQGGQEVTYQTEATQGAQASGQPVDLQDQIAMIGQSWPEMGQEVPESRGSAVRRR